jgi:2,3-bisphosphoglycerate-independent phosphoglycerate mutase
MKGIFIIIDGLGDLPNDQLGGMTPLEAASTPNLDFLATRGDMGYMYPVKPGFVPESDEAIVSIFGNDLIDSTRGQLEARGTDLKLTRGDLALRCNFATIDSLEKGNVVDRRAGRTLTTGEAKVLAKALNKIKLPVKFDFVPTIQHRASLVFRGGFSDNISGNDATYFQGKTETITKIIKCKPLDEEDNTTYTSNIVNEFLEKSFEVLDQHPVNKERRRKGLQPANYLMVRGGGIEPPKLKQYKKWVSANYMPLEIGFSRVCGMKNYAFEYPKLEGVDAYENLWKGLKKACKYSVKFLKKTRRSADYAYIHIKETDLPGHDNKPFEKKLMIEYLDITLFKFLRGFAPPNKIKVVVTADHSTPCKLKGHSDDPVPVLFYPADENKIPEEKRFDEKEAKKGKLGLIQGRHIMERVGFVD